MNACNLASCAAMRASSASTTVTGDSRRAAISAARRGAGRKLGSVVATGMALPLLRIEPPVDPGRADIVAHEGADAVAPGVAVAGPRPGLAFRDVRVLELVEGQIFRLAVDGDKAARAKTARHRHIRREVGRVVPVVEFLLD